MRGGRPSTTASIVASARGAAGVDPVAPRLVPRALRTFARERAWTRHLPLVDHMRVRTLAIDEAAQAAADRGTRQLVVLGAGLCARAWRMDRLDETTVYEVDYPSTQRYKRSRLDGLAPKARAVRFVSVDFEVDDLGASVADAGHDERAPTTWIWEGVTPYLTPGAIAGTMDAVRARSSPASTFIVTYATPLASHPGQRRVYLELVRPFFRAIGEPLAGLLTADEMHGLLAARGFDVTDDATYAQLARHLGVRVPLTGTVIGERIVVATLRAEAGCPS